MKYYSIHPQILEKVDKELHMRGIKVIKENTTSKGVIQSSWKIN